MVNMLLIQSDYELTITGVTVQVVAVPLHQLTSWLVGILRRNYAHCTPVESSYQLTKLLIVTKRLPKVVWFRWPSNI